jgi:hypothetical protein
MLYSLCIGILKRLHYALYIGILEDALCPVYWNFRRCIMPRVLGFRKRKMLVFWDFRRMHYTLFIGILEDALCPVYWNI